MNIPSEAPTATRVTLHGLLGGHGRRFHIPYYQRKYAWTEENCKVLLDDILAAGQQTDQTHFFSNVTLSPLDADDGYYVVDGQQRLTTFSLLLEALRQEFRDVDALASLLHKYLLTGELLKLAFEDQMDQRTYRHLLLGHFCDRENTSGTMSGNFVFFQTEIGKNREAWRLALERGVLERLLLVQVILPTKMSPQRIFERMNAAKLEIGQFDLIKNFLLMEAGGPDEQREVYDRLEERLGNPHWRTCIQALVSMHARKEIPQTRIYKPFKEFFRHGPVKAMSASQFLDRVESWIQGFNMACWAFNQLGLELDEWRVYGSSGYGALLMKLAVVYPSPENEPRRNELIAQIVDSIRSHIAVTRLNHARKMHPQRHDAWWVYGCLEASGEYYDKDVLADAIEKSSFFRVYPREQVDASIRHWVNEKLEQEGYVNNAASIGIAGRPTDSAEDAVQRYHELFTPQKQEL